MGAELCLHVNRYTSCAAPGENAPPNLRTRCSTGDRDMTAAMSLPALAAHAAPAGPELASPVSTDIASLAAVHLKSTGRKGAC